MNKEITITLNEHLNDGGVSIKTFRIADDIVYRNIINELQFCKIKSDLLFYPNEKN